MIGAIIRGSTRGPRAHAGIRGLVLALADLNIAHAGWLTLASSAGLTLLGLYAIDVSLGFGDEGAPGLHPIAIRQGVFAVVGVTAGTIIALPHYRLIGRLSWPLMALSIGLLAFLILPGVPRWLVTPRNGARAWINLGPADFQPSEVAKIAFVLATAWFLRFRRAHRRFLGLVPPALIAAAPIGLIMLQPDLGTACLFVPVLMAILIAGGARLRHLSIIVLAAALAAPAAYPLLQTHQKARIVALWNQVQGSREGADDINFQSFTAQKLTGAGRLAGTSDAHARALVHFNRLPERHNDMIFAVVATRFGVFGAVSVLLGYALWVSGALLVAVASRDPFARLIAVGLAAFVTAQAFVNIGMTIGLLPIIGVPAPFVSYGGSSMLTAWLMTGLIMNVALHRPRPPLRDSFEYASDDD